jgi:dephospho-CoA kinase
MLIGLTGGIGSGKSTVAAMLVRTHGAVLVDTDLIARQLTQPRGAAMPAVAQSFGAQVVAGDGSLDRAAMRALVFEDASARLRLEAILHPMIGAEAARQAAAAGQANVVFDVPLLAESDHWRDRVDRVLVVDCPESVQVARVAERPGWTHDAASAVISQQATRAARRRCADAVIYNHGLSLLQLEREVDTLCARWFASG